MELRRKMRIGPLLMAAGLLLVLCAAALAGYNLWDGARAGREAARVLEQLPQALPDSKTPEETPEYLLNPQMEMLRSETGMILLPMQSETNHSTEALLKLLLTLSYDQLIC